ncbi:MAG: helix-turn-helix domain-containing protein [Oscillospiraceae bacterium]|nr:helix-turn-helix domain-containing protein [Oscillospiraceae bacterium]
MSSRIFQSVVLQMKDATSRTIGVVEYDGSVVSCSDTSLIGVKWLDVIDALNEMTDSVLVFEGRTFRPLSSWGTNFDYAVFADGTDEEAKTICMMAAVALNGAKTYYEEKHDKATFVKNIITDNILPGDIYIRAKELRFPTEQLRAVFLVRQVDKTDIAVMDVLQSMFTDKQQDFIISINETDIALIKHVTPEMETADLYTIGQQIEDTIKSELYIKTIIGIGSVANHLRELADSYKEAQTAIEVVKVFDTDKTIIHYENLGIGRLIYQLPTTLCEMFLSEVFKKNTIDSLDQETLFTINKFFENNLNVSETSRKLFVHRNTLVYRLEKIKKLTGLDLREFDHAIIFKVALMVKKYLQSREQK